MLIGGVIGAVGIQNPRRAVCAEECGGGQLVGAPPDAAGLHKGSLLGARGRPALKGFPLAGVHAGNNQRKGDTCLISSDSGQGE